ncbi:MAG: hypothetical protein M3464_00295 [Chloroflexota bacterium]|nr:hypothetical protein [Chloroflexota bacterium]
MLSMYVWNIALCEALYPALNMLEKSLRNTIHHAVSAQFKSDTWFDTPGLLRWQQQRDIAIARKKIADRRKPESVDRIVAELGFGFWTTILSRDYHNGIWNRNNATPLALAFPHLTGRLFQRNLIHARFNDLRGLRNRVFHFEPIWNHPALLVRHGQIVETIGWISPTSAGLLNAITRFSVVYNHGLASSEEQVLAYALSTIL